MSGLFVCDPSGSFIPADDDAILLAAGDAAGRLMSTGQVFDGLKTAKKFLPALLASKETESFYIGHLNADNRLIAFEELFKGTIDTVPVYAREVVKSVIRHNSHKAFVVHNHPSGGTEPSEPDLKATKVVFEALATIEVELVDHYVVGGNEVGSIKDYMRARLEELQKQGPPPALKGFLERLEGKIREAAEETMGVESGAGAVKH